MNSKLTLRMDSDLIKKAKSYARERNMSLSCLTQRCYRALLSELPDNQISPLVRELSGIIDMENIVEIDCFSSTKEEYSQ